jgi:ribosome-associated protein
LFCLLTPKPEASQIPARKTPELRESPAKLKDFIFKSLDDDKGEEIEIIDLKQQSSLADFIVIATGRSSRQVAAMADKLVDRLAEAGVKDVRVEGQRSGDWVIVDAGDVVVHLFRPEVRAFYNIERMWRSAPLFEVAASTSA